MGGSRTWMPMDDPFDPNRFGLPDTPPIIVSRPMRPRPRAGGKYLKGPIPMDWLATAMKLPGKALAVGLILRFETGCNRRPNVDLTLARLTRWGLTEKMARRGLHALESAGLVTVDRPPGRAMLVTVCDRAPPGRGPRQGA